MESVSRLVLQRFSSDDQGTFGIMAVPNGEFLEYFYSGELPWQDNKSNVSCIPIGLYACEKTYSERFKRELYLVKDVTGRTGIRIHSANFMGNDTKGFKKQLNGCIALGERLGFMDGQRALLLSLPAIRRFEALMKNRPFELEIKDGSS